MGQRPVFGGESNVFGSLIENQLDRCVTGFVKGDLAWSFIHMFTNSGKRPSRTKSRKSEPGERFRPSVQSCGSAKRISYEKDGHITICHATISEHIITYHRFSGNPQSLVVVFELFTKA